MARRQFELADFERRKAAPSISTDQHPPAPAENVQSPSLHEATTTTHRSTVFSLAELKEITDYGLIPGTKSFACDLCWIDGNQPRVFVSSDGHRFPPVQPHIFSPPAPVQPQPVNSRQAPSISIDSLLNPVQPEPHHLFAMYRQPIIEHPPFVIYNDQYPFVANLPEQPIYAVPPMDHDHDRVARLAAAMSKSVPKAPAHDWHRPVEPQRPARYNAAPVFGSRLRRPVHVDWRKQALMDAGVRNQRSDDEMSGGDVSDAFLEPAQELQEVQEERPDEGIAEGEGLGSRSTRARRKTIVRDERFEEDEISGDDKRGVRLEQRRRDERSAEEGSEYNEDEGADSGEEDWELSSEQGLV